jgi:hypothetical protein
MGRNNRVNIYTLLDVDGAPVLNQIFIVFIHQLCFLSHRCLRPTKTKKNFLNQKWRSMLVLPLEVNNNNGAVLCCLALFCVVSCCIAWCRPVLPSGREGEAPKEINSTSFSSFAGSHCFVTTLNPGLVFVKAWSSLLFAVRTANVQPLKLRTAKVSSQG